MPLMCSICALTVPKLTFLYFEIEIEIKIEIEIENKFGHVQLHTLKIITVLVYPFLKFRLLCQSGYFLR